MIKRWCRLQSAISTIQLLRQKLKIINSSMIPYSNKNDQKYQITSVLMHKLEFTTKQFHFSWRFSPFHTLRFILHARYFGCATGDYAEIRLQTCEISLHACPRDGLRTISEWHCTGWAKNVSYCTLSISSLNIDQFHNFFASGLCKKCGVHALSMKFLPESTCEKIVKK